MLLRKFYHILFGSTVWNIFYKHKIEFKQIRAVRTNKRIKQRTFYTSLGWHQNWAQNRCHLTELWRESKLFVVKRTRTATKRWRGGDACGREPLSEAAVGTGVVTVVASDAPCLLKNASGPKLQEVQVQWIFFAPFGPKVKFRRRQASARQEKQFSVTWSEKKNSQALSENTRVGRQRNLCTW